MKAILILLLFGIVYSQDNSDFILPSDFSDRKPDLPDIILPNFSDDDSGYSNSINVDGLVKGYRVQVAISENQEDLIDIKDNLEKVIKEKIYIQFELPNYKLRVGNFSSRKKAELYRNKIVRLGYRSAWVIPTLIESDS
ncbi:MAG: SPOR domain-containing protein [Candidatus Neomarinimicrobiota bacterium]|jgi:hypothetical protein|nr:SPOR domain-containing protein [Candidatus Neomarinimicrobiota bacterium]|tara:strand:+ start:206 stop:622 length:417 start_codon:yes stop_codon:yes gene_type:complete